MSAFLQSKQRYQVTVRLAVAVLSDGHRRQVREGEFLPVEATDRCVAHLLKLGFIRPVEEN